MANAASTAARLLSTLDVKALAHIGSLIYRLADGPGCEDELRAALAALDTKTPLLDVAAVAAGIELADMGERGGFLMHVTSSAGDDPDMDDLMSEADGEIDPYSLGPPLIAAAETVIDQARKRDDEWYFGLLYAAFAAALPERIERCLKRHRAERS